MPLSCTPRAPTPRRAALSIGCLGFLVACATRPAASLVQLCSGGRAVAAVDASIDSLRPSAGPALAAATGRHFTMHFDFSAATSAATSGSAGCSGRTGAATFAGDFPDAVRNAVAPSHQARWRVEGQMVLLDLNPGTRDNNVFVALPVNGGNGHWGLSTFAGEVASGRTVPVP